MAEKPKSSLGPAGETLRQNIKRIREGQRITYVELSERLDSVGRPIPVLGLRRIERGERRVDVDDLLALAYALGVPPVDLLVPGDLTSSEPYSITPEVHTQAGPARAWIRGDAYVPDHLGDPGDPFGIPVPTAWEADPNMTVRWMPRGRSDQLLQWMISSIPMEPIKPDESGEGQS
ncbi:helix-turn-helix domain-containing protein [Streptomyces sp. NPDC002889]|uniref:helix-turn-helix domain-containing protein n=1 Tax=Streptomyces sp. NPDC002889 TaxID=3364669 RepID=UPI0036A409AD